MTFSIRATTRALAAPKHRLSCPRGVWRRGLAEIARRGEGHHESGAFLLGFREGLRGRVARFAYYDDFDPTCLDSGIVVFDGAGFGHCGNSAGDRSDGARRLAHARWTRTGQAELA